MKFSLSTPFSRLTIFALVAILLTTFGGRLIALDGSMASCLSYPLCLPVDLGGWAQILHRFTAAISTLIILAMMYAGWRTHNNHLIAMPIITITGVLYFAELFTGALIVVRQSTAMSSFHLFTLIALWISSIALVLSAGYFSNKENGSTPALDIRQRLKDLLALTKPIVLMLLLVTTYAGLVAGGKEIPSFALTLWTLIGGAFAAGGSGALNQFIDRDLDKNMQRTSNRPLATGRMTPAEGLAYGLALCVISFYVFAGFTNFLAAFLSLAGIFYYVWLYSILLKKATVQNIVIGGGAGALPPMVGWAAATGRLDLTAFILFAIIFFWTPPHFWALALVRRNEYERAGVPMLPVVRGEKETRWQIWIYSIVLFALTLTLPLLNLVGNIYLYSAVALGAGLLFAAWRVYRIGENKIAWQMYKYTSMYLMLLFIAIMVDAVWY